MKTKNYFILGITLAILISGVYLYLDRSSEDPTIQEQSPETGNSEVENSTPNDENVNTDSDEPRKEELATKSLETDIDSWLLYGGIFASLVMALLLVTTLLLFREVRWRKRHSRNESLVFPDAHLDVLENLQKGFNELATVMFEFGKSSNELQARNEELSEQTIESISTFSNLIDQQKSEIDRLKEGYDFSIKKHSIKALVELKSLIANFYKEELSQETKEKLDKITNYINLDLEELDVEELNFKEGISYREISSDEFEISGTDATTDESLYDTVIETVSSGYVHVHPDGRNVIKKAKLKIYIKEG